MSWEIVAQIVIGFFTVFVSVYGAHELIERKAKRERLSVLLGETYLHVLNNMSEAMQHLAFGGMDEKSIEHSQVMERTIGQLLQDKFRIELEVGERGKALLLVLKQITAATQAFSYAPTADIPAEWDIYQARMTNIVELVEHEMKTLLQSFDSEMAISLPS